MSSVPAIANTPQDLTSLDRSEESATQALYRAVIGPINTDYYLSVFARFDAANGAGLSWNWAASFYTLNWMLFRHLKWAALTYAGAVLATALLLLGLGRLLLPATDEVQLGLLLLLALGAFVLPGLAGNALFYRHCRQLMTQALAATTNWTDAGELLQKQASSRQHFIRLAWANITLTLAALALAGWLYLDPTDSSSAVPASNTAAAPTVAASAPASATSPLVQSSAAASASGVSSSAAQPPTVAASAALAAPSAPIAASASVPAPVPSASSPASASEPTPTAATVVHSATASLAAGSSAAPASAAIKPAARKKSSVKPSAEERPFYINVGLFADEDNARRAYGKLRLAGLPALRQRIHAKNGLLTRVRVGPLESQSQANATAEKVHALELEAMIVQP